MPTTTFDIQDGPSDEQKAAEAAALEQGEKIAQMQAEDRARKYEQVDQDNADASLIGGKFKSQDDLLKAYEELQKKLGQKTPDEEEEPAEETTEAVEETPEEEVEATDADKAILRASTAFNETGELTDESIEELAQLDSKDLIRAYFKQYQANAAAAQQQSLQESEVASLKQLAGGEEAYGEMIQWASANLDAEEIGAFNSATQSGNAAAARFAIESLKSRYTASEGFEAPLVTGKKAAPSVQGYRSNAELARDIADPRYHSDPAFRADVESRLARSGDLL